MTTRIPTSMLQTFGALRFSERGSVEIQLDAIDMVRIHIHTPGQPGLATQFVLAGEHLYQFEAELAKIVRAAKRAERKLEVAS